MAVKGLARGALIVAGVAMLGCGAVAQDAKSPVAAPRPAGGYLAPALLPDSLSIVGAPPAPDSDQARADRAAFDASRALEGSPRWSQAIADVELFGDKAHRSFSCAIGKEISAAKTPVLSKLLDRLVLDAGGSTSAAKKKYQRDRPMIGHDEAFQSDVSAGQVMAAATFARLHAEPAFTADMALAKAELDKAPAPEGCGV